MSESTAASDPALFGPGRSTDYALGLVSGLPQLRSIARGLGYALAVHGSMARDFDLIAVPWTPEAVTADELADVICQTVNGHVRKLEGQIIDHNPGLKPHGRKAYSFYLCEFEGSSYGPYIDLSVMPREQDRE